MIQEEAVLGSMSVAVALTSDQVGLVDITVPPMRHHDDYQGVRALDIELEEGMRLIAVQHADEVEVIGSETRVRPGDEIIIIADTDLIPAPARSYAPCSLLRRCDLPRGCDVGEGATASLSRATCRSGRLAFVRERSFARPFLLRVGLCASC